jgi:hypothetical protein
MGCLVLLYGAMWCVLWQIWNEVGEMAVGSRIPTLEAPFAATNCQDSVEPEPEFLKT